MMALRQRALVLLTQTRWCYAKTAKLWLRKKFQTALPMAAMWAATWRIAIRQLEVFALMKTCRVMRGLRILIFVDRWSARAILPRHWICGACIWATSKAAAVV